MTQGTYPRSAIATLVFWLAALVGMGALSLVVSSELATGERLKPVTVQPPLFFLGVTMIAGAAGVLWTASWKPGWKYAPPWVGMMLSLFSIGLVLASFLPGKGTLIVRDIIAVDLEAPPPPGFGAIVLFANGSDSLEPSEAAGLKRSMQIFKDCQAPELLVRGFASSAPFAIDTNQRNLELANRRANRVARELAAGGMPPKIRTWVSFEQMMDARRVNDEGEGRRLKAEEAQNRRVEVLWQGSSCTSTLWAEPEKQ